GTCTTARSRRTRRRPSHCLIQRRVTRSSTASTSTLTRTYRFRTEVGGWTTSSSSPNRARQAFTEHDDGRAVEALSSSLAGPWGRSGEDSEIAGPSYAGRGTEHLESRRFGHDRKGGKMTKPIPEGYHTATPYLTLDDAAGASDFH